MSLFLFTKLDNLLHKYSIFDHSIVILLGFYDRNSRKSLVFFNK